MPDQKIAELLHELIVSTRIMANEKVLDAFGHVSVRHPSDPGRYLLSRARSPLLIEPGDILEYTLDSAPVRPPKVHLYAERVIHGCIYQARSDVMAVCHHHAPAVMPFAIAGKPIVPVFHLGAAMGEEAPFWDQHDEFGDTNMLVVKPVEGASLARALGKHPMVLMRRHGVTVIGANARECVYRAVQTCRNAEFQVRALAISPNIASLSPGETERCGDIIGKTTGVTRCWDSWALRIAKAGGLPASGKSTKSNKSKASSRRASPRERAKARRR